MSEHCWHPTGYGTTHWTGGSEDVVCCWCGQRGQRSWHTEHHRIDGHGPHFSSTSTVTGDVHVTQPGAEQCARAATTEGGANG